MNPETLALMIPILALCIPIVAILAKSRRTKGPVDSQQQLQQHIAQLEEKVRQLEETVHSLSSDVTRLEDKQSFLTRLLDSK